MKLHRRILPFMLPLLGLMSLTTSCVYDDEPLVPDTPWDGTHTGQGGKLSIQIRVRTLGDEGSRTDANGSLVDGSHIEHRIGALGNFAIFFNEDNTFYSISLLELTEEETPDNKIIETVYKATLNPDDFENLPKKCLFMLNAPDYYELFSDYDETKTVNDALTQIWTEVQDPRNMGRTDDGYFVMTNSIYYDKNNVMQSVVTLTDKMIYDPNEPKERAEHEVLTVYMERLSAKFTIEVQNDLTPEGYLYDELNAQPIVFFNGFNAAGSPQFVESKWQILVTGWGVNGYETKTKVFKFMQTGKDYFPGWPGWKDAAAFRTYWSEDPHYGGRYPSQYRRADDVLTTELIDSYEVMADESENQLRNYSFTDLKLDDVTTMSQSLYSPENTYDYNVLKPYLGDRTDVLAGTHVLIGAKLMTQGKKGPMAVRDVWRDRDGYYYETELECLESLLHNLKNTLTSQEYMRYPFYQWGKGGVIGSTETAKQNYTLNGQILYAMTDAVHGNLTYQLYWNGQLLDDTTIGKLYEDDMTDKATVTRGDGQRMPWPKEGTLEIYAMQGTTKVPLKIYRLNESTGTMVSVRNATSDDIKSLLFEWLGTIDHFNEGAMYYAVPALIKPGLGTDGADICGVVRNAWYQYNLKSLSKMGTPVDDLSEPIVPLSVSYNDQINMTIKIIDWHHFNSWIDKLP